MKETWDKFWKNKSKNFEWSQNDVLVSKGMNRLYSKVLLYLKKDNIRGLKFLELGSGIGIGSFFFASKSADITLLDNSNDVKKSISEYWQNRFKYKFVNADLFKFKTKTKYYVISSFGLCEHFVGKQRTDVLKKHIEFLTKDGIAIISVPYKYGIFYQGQKKIQELIGTWSFGVEIPFTKKEFYDFSKQNNLTCEIICGGFLSSMYDFFIRKPLKLIKINTKRRFDDTSAGIFDTWFGSGIQVILQKKK